MLSTDPAAAGPEGKQDVTACAPKTFTQSFSGVFGGERLDYSATASETSIRNEKDELVASIFSVSYLRQRTGADRPVVFLFNGGPGTSSLFLHIGLLGPKRVPLPRETIAPGNAPFRIEDNGRSILDIADLVFVDPIGTGYSRALGKATEQDYWGVKEDARVLTEFMRIWLTKHGRWNAPKHLLGESYGTTRAVQIVAEFQQAFTGVMPTGVILLSAALDIRSIVFAPGNDAPYVYSLPTYAATALFHGKVNPRPTNPQQFLDEARAFAVNEYSVALLKGSTLNEQEHGRIVENLSFFTGLSKEYIARANLRVDAGRFRKELLRDRGQIVGHLDGRYLGQDSDSAGETPESDPASSAMDHAYVATYLDYLTRVLGVDVERPYLAYGRDVSRNWKWTQPGELPIGLNLGPILGSAMRTNPKFRVLLGSGIYDFATPIFASESTFAHNGIRSEQVIQRRYEAGHMMYTHEPSMEAVTRDIRAFIRGAADRSRQ